MNYLSPHLQAFFKEMALIKGKKSVFTSFVQNFKNQLLQRETRDRQLIGLITCFRDLSQLDSNINLYETGCHYGLNASTMSSEIDSLLSWEYYIILSQSYELFETYLYDLFTEFFFRNQQHLSLIKIKESDKIITPPLIRQSLKREFRQKNNKKFLSTLRLLSLHYHSHENNNIWNINVSAWLNLIAEIRHIVVHRRLLISRSIEELLTSDATTLSLFEKYFDKNDNMLYISGEKLEMNLQLFHSIAHFIFKALSIDFNLRVEYP